MTEPLYTVTDLAELLAKLPIGTSESQEILEFARRLDNRYQWQSKRANVAATMLGHSMIEEALMDENDV